MYSIFLQLQLFEQKLFRLWESFSWRVGHSLTESNLSITAYTVVVLVHAFDSSTVGLRLRVTWLGAIMPLLTVWDQADALPTLSIELSLYFVHLII